MKKLLLVLLILMGWVVPVRAADEETPVDAPWTIYCQSFSGEMRAQQAKMAKDAMIKATAMKQWYVIHQEAESVLFYGHYRATNLQAEDAKDRKDAQRAHEDIKKIQTIEDADKNRVFPLTVFVQTPQPGSEGPPEWDLKKLPEDKYWTVYVGIYRDNPLRRKAAVEAVKAMRDDNIEAYYYHDTNASLICIGAWPAAAVKEPDEAVATVDDPNLEIMAVGAPVDPKVPREFKRSDGKQVRLYSNKATIQDPTLQSTIDRHPYFYINGEALGQETNQIDPSTGKKKVVPNMSQLFKIPRTASTVARQQQQQQAQERAMQELKAGKAAPKGAGKLNKLED